MGGAVGRWAGRHCRWPNHRARVPGCGAGFAAPSSVKRSFHAALPSNNRQVTHPRTDPIAPSRRPPASTRQTSSKEPLASWVTATAARPDQNLANGSSNVQRASGCDAVQKVVGGSIERENIPINPGSRRAKSRGGADHSGQRQAISHQAMPPVAPTNIRDLVSAAPLNLLAPSTRGFAHPWRCRRAGHALVRRMPNIESIARKFTHGPESLLKTFELSNHSNVDCRIRFCRRCHSGLLQRKRPACSSVQLMLGRESEA